MTAARVRLLAVAGLLLLQPLWFAWLAPPTVLPPGIVTTVTATPLAILLIGLWRGGRFESVLTGCVLLIYFCYAVMEAWVGGPAQVPAMIQIALVVVFFSALPWRRPPPAGSTPGPS